MSDEAEAVLNAQSFVGGECGYGIAIGAGGRSLAGSAVVDVADGFGADVVGQGITQGTLGAICWGRACRAVSVGADRIAKRVPTINGVASRTVRAGGRMVATDAVLHSALQFAISSIGVIGVSACASGAGCFCRTTVAVWIITN